MIQVAILQSLTGTMSLSESPLVSAAQMAISEINAAGGCLGERVESIILDGASDPHEFAKHAKVLSDRGVSNIFGCWTSSSRIAVKDVIEGTKTQLWYPVQYEGLEESPNIYYTGSPLNQQIEPAVLWCMRNLGKRFYLLGSDYVFPRTANALIRSIVLQNGGEILAEDYHPLGDNDFEVTVEEINRHKPSVVFNTLNGDSNLALYKSLHEKGMLPSEFPTMSVSIGEVEVNQMPQEFQGHYACWGYFQSLNTKENQSFVEKYLAKDITSLGITSDPVATAYTQVHLWAKAVNAAGSLKQEEVRSALKSINFESPLGKIKIQDNSHVKRMAYVGKANASGQFEVIWSSDAQIEPLPWLGIENIQLPSAKLIMEAMAQLPRSINLNISLENEVLQRKQAQKQTQHERDLAQTYLNTASVMMVAIDKDMCVVLANQKACEVLGCSEHEIIGKNWFDTFIPKEQVDTVKAVFNRIILREESIVEFYKNSVLTQDGRERIVAWHNSLLTDEDGTISSILSSGEDITERELAEKELACLNSELEQKNKALTEAVSTIKTISGVVPLCAWCHEKVEADSGEWIKLEEYLEDHSTAHVSPGVCPSCKAKVLKHV